MLHPGMDPAWSGRGGGGAHFFRGPYLKKFSRKNFFRRATTSSRRRQLFREKMFLDEYVAFVFQWLYLSINLLHYCEVWFDYSIWIVIVVHSLLIIMLLLKLLNLILSLIIFCFIMKNSTPCTPWPGLGGVHPPPHTPPVNPFLDLHLHFDRRITVCCISIYKLI